MINIHHRENEYESYEHIDKQISKKDLLLKFEFLIIGCFLIAVAFNVFEAPRNFVTGGVSGLAVVFDSMFGINTSNFILVGNIICLTIGLIFLGLRKTINMAIGAGMFILMAYLTEDINLLLNIHFSNIFLDILANGILVGVGSGILYKTGYSSGGMDIIAIVMNEKLKMSLGNANLYLALAVMAVGLYVFGLELLLYSLIIRVISSVITDKVLIGIGDAKIFIVQTDKKYEIKQYIFNVINSGVTKIEARGGYTNEDSDLLMCVVPTEKYLRLKSAIMEIDPNAFLVITDCYEVHGGTKRYNSPLRHIK